MILPLIAQKMELQNSLTGGSEELSLGLIFEIVKKAIWSIKMNIKSVFTRMLTVPLVTLPLIGGIAASVTFLTIATPSMAQTSIQEIQRNSNLTITGEVKQIWDSDEFVLSDGTGDILVDTEDTFVNLSVGEKVTVAGRYDDEQFEAFSITREDGTVIYIRR